MSYSFESFRLQIMQIYSVLIEYWKQYHKSKPRIILQLGRKELEYIKTWAYSGHIPCKHFYDEQYKDLLDSMNAEIEEVDRENYLWIREKL